MPNFAELAAGMKAVASKVLAKPTAFLNNSPKLKAVATHINNNKPWYTAAGLMTGNQVINWDKDRMLRAMQSNTSALDATPSQANANLSEFFTDPVVIGGGATLGSMMLLDHLYHKNKRNTEAQRPTLAESPEEL